MKKYPRTYHLPFSPEVHSDDKVCDISDIQKIIDNEIPVVISEKLDGGNTCLSPEGVFARSHAQQTSCSSFNYIKNVHYYPHLQSIKGSNIKVFGENMFAIHSIEYSNLKDYFYMFNILKQNENVYMDLDGLVSWATIHDMKVVPMVYIGEIESMNWLESFLEEELKKPSELGGEREGFVLRVQNEFHEDDFSKSVFKYVRKNHVQQNADHWRRNWKQAKLSN